MDFDYFLHSIYMDYSKIPPTFGNPLMWRDFSEG